MTRATIAAGAFVAVVVLVGLAVGHRTRERGPEPANRSAPLAPATPTPPATAPSSTAPAERDHQGFLYGRVTTEGDDTYEGRLRWGDGAEGFWGDFLNGVHAENVWTAQVAPENLPRKRDALELFGLELSWRERLVDLRRPFVIRFGDVARIDAEGRDVRVTSKSGAVFRLDRHEAGDFDDGVRVWDGERGAVDLGARQIRSIELLPTARLADAPRRLSGTVRTTHGDFTGFVQWNREACVGTDELHGRAAEDWTTLPFDSIRAIARDGDDGARVTLRDGRELTLTDTPEVNADNRGVYVDDRRYGRVLVSWGVFERLDFDEARGSGPGYAEFPPGSRLAGSVATRDGRRLAGRLVFDLDESETTEMLDAPAGGVDYAIPFGRIAAIALPAGSEGGDRIRLTLRGGEELELEPEGDLGEANAGLLVFVDGGEGPAYVRWSDVDRIDFERPPTIDPPLGGR